MSEEWHLDWFNDKILDYLKYTPVTLTPDDSEKYYNGKQLSWWSDNALLPYNAMLVSAKYGMNKIKNRDKIRDDVLVIGDSGGYQILQNNLGNLYDPNINKKLTWQKVIEWQMNVCDIGMTLDVPPPRTKTHTYTPEEFKNNLEISKKNALAMYKYKTDNYIENDDFQLFNCIHGANYDEMEMWYKETTNNHDIEYDGFALSGNGAKHLLPLRLGFAIEHSNGIPYHILGVSSPQLLMLIAYANKFTKTMVYFDSTAVALGKMHNKYFTDSYFPISVSKATEINMKNKEPITCDCPVCQQLERPSDMLDIPTKSGTLATLHNLYLMASYTGLLNVYANSELPFFFGFMKQASNNKWLFQCIEYLDAVYEDGFQNAWNMYCDILCKDKVKEQKKI